jgi:KaiC/GvpD/RAD55 family RecA-like ATPase
MSGATARASQRQPFHRAPDLVAAIRKGAGMPWVELRVTSDGPAVVRVRVGSLVYLVGSEGSGKSSFLLQTGTGWARDHGVFIYFTVELDEEEAGGRVVGQHARASWETALRGNVPEEVMAEALGLPRFAIIAGEDAESLDSIGVAVEAYRKEFPDVPIVVGVDYIQAIDGEGRDPRAQVSSISKKLRKLAKRLSVVIVGVSQTSRGNREPLRSGAAVGADTVTMGAETSQIERDAYVTMALGNLEPLPDGTTKLDLNIGKTRMGQGDRVYKLLYDGASGIFTMLGDVRTGAEVRAERKSKDDEAKIQAAMLALPAALADAPQPMFIADLAKELVIRKDTVTEAIKRLRADPDSAVVKVRWQASVPPGTKKRRANGAFPLWDRTRATGAGLEIFRAGFGGNADD